MTAGGLERTGFERLVHEHRDEVARICRSILRDEHLGADAAQEAFLRLWRQLDGGRGPAHARAWLRRAAVSAALDLARRRSVRERADAGLRRQAPGDAGLAPSGPVEAARHAELAAALETAVAALPEGQRTIFRLRHDGALALAEIAAVLGLALPTVKTQFARACLKLQARLSAHAPDRDDAR